MEISDLDRRTADEIIEQLRRGIPPYRHTSVYSAGHEKFLAAVRRRHLAPSPSSGKIRFISGSWGTGKTHFFRLLTEEAFDAGYLVSTVELSAQETPFNKFELVLAAIIRNIAVEPRKAGVVSTAPIGDVLRQALEKEAHDDDLTAAAARLKDRLFSDQAIDIDVKRVVSAYWDTFTAETQDTVVLEDRRGQLLQWFTGDSHKPTMRKEFDVQKAVSKENARIILGSVAALIRLLGHEGLLILFDESEMTHSTMSKSSLRLAHNNLLHLINEVGEIPGLFLVYAAVPDFWNDPRTGITIYGALAARVGSLPEHPPRALETVWNLDSAETSEDDFCTAALRIQQVFQRAYPDDDLDHPTPEELTERVKIIVKEHGEFHAVSRWRVVVKETVKLLDQALEGDDLLPPLESYRETVSALERLGDD